MKYLLQVHCNAPVLHEDDSFKVPIFFIAVSQDFWQFSDFIWDACFVDIRKVDWLLGLVQLLLAILIYYFDSLVPLVTEYVAVTL